MKMTDGHTTKANAFRQLHTGTKLLILPNAWDAGSARAIQECGFEAIGTTSAGIAFSNGFPDGQHIPFEYMLSRVRSIVRSVEVPVTVDMENGYSNNPITVEENTRRLLEIGAVGINLEDGCPSQLKLAETEEQIKKIESVKRASFSEGIPLFINARIDTYWLKNIEQSDRYQETVSRAKVYLEAGADGIFVPGISDLSLMSQLAEVIQAPLNVLAGGQTPSAQAISVTGVSRLSIGSGFYRASVSYLKMISMELRSEGSISSHLRDAISYQVMNDEYFN